MLDGNKDENGNYDGNIYNNDDITNNDYRVKYKSLVGTAAGEEEPPTIYGRLDGLILEVGKWVTYDDGDDNDNINKSDGSLSGRPHSNTMVLSIGWITANFPPDIYS